jgi:hypothetical protein
VIGSLKDNSFIRQQQEELKQFKKQAVEIAKNFGDNKKTSKQTKKTKQTIVA